MPKMRRNHHQFLQENSLSRVRTKTHIKKLILSIWQYFKTLTFVGIRSPSTNPFGEGEFSEINTHLHFIPFGHLTVVAHIIIKITKNLFLFSVDRQR